MEKVCKNFKKCGGCQLQNMSYDEQLRYKQRELDTLLSRFCRVNRIIGMENPYHYRNKVQSAFYYDYRRKKTVSGVFQSTSKKIVPCDSCMLEDEISDRIIITIRQLCDSFRLKPFDKRTLRGFLRHVLIRRGFATGEIMVVLVSAVPAFPSKNNFVKALTEKHPEITTVVHNVNNYETDLLLGENSKVLYGKGYIEDVLCGKTFRISPESFYQVNPVQCEILYGKAIEFAELTGREVVFDSYCGTGTIGIIASDKAKQVVGVEINKKAVYDAISNAKRNGIKNIYFEAGDAGQYLNELSKTKERFDVIMLDPPRAGSSVQFLKSAVKMKPKRIVYISCNPKTLARDLNFLTKNEYRAEEIQGVDMFPFTKHIEAVVKLTRK